MEFLEGETLTHRMQRRGEQSITLSEILRFMRQVTSALGAVHAQGIVHRDLKADNLMLVADPEVQGGERVKILDFGIAKVREPNEGGARNGYRNENGNSRMPPEQVYGANKVDGSADIYSLGVILFELLSGRLPFEGDQRQVLGGHLFDHLLMYGSSPRLFQNRLPSSSRGCSQRAWRAATCSRVAAGVTDYSYYARR